MFLSQISSHSLQKYQSRKAGRIAGVRDFSIFRKNMGGITTWLWNLKNAQSKDSREVYIVQTFLWSSLVIWGSNQAITKLQKQPKIIMKRNPNIELYFESKRNQGVPILLFLNENRSTCFTTTARNPLRLQRLLDASSELLIEPSKKSRKGTAMPLQVDVDDLKYVLIVLPKEL